VVYPADAELTEEEMILANAASESKEAEQTIQRAALVLRMREGIGSLSRILKTIEVSSTMRCHVSHESISVAKVPTFQLHSILLWLPLRQPLVLHHKNTFSLTGTVQQNHV
jgi:hypothetical protein